MAYVGNVPAVAYTNTVKDTFSGDGSTVAFTLSLPTTTNNVRVVVENVIQDPTVAYGVSGTTLTFTSAPPSGTNNIYVVHLGPAVQTVQPPTQLSGNFTLTGSLTASSTVHASNIPATGTVITTTSTFAGTGPAFSAYQNASTSFPNNTGVKVLFGVEEFDTNSNFASSTFTPTVAGYYQITAKVAFSVDSANTRFVALYKNGSKVVDIAVGVVNGLNFAEVGGSYLISMNGTTDYLEIYGFQNSGSTLTSDGGVNTYFQAVLVRDA